jgi:hypothetical protein
VKLPRPLHRLDLSALLKHPCRQPFADQPDNPPIVDPMLNEPYQPRTADRVERRHHRLPIPKTFRLQWSSSASGVPSKDPASP